MILTIKTNEDFNTNFDTLRDLGVAELVMRLMDNTAFGSLVLTQEDTCKFCKGVPKRIKGFIHLKSRAKADSLIRMGAILTKLANWFVMEDEKPLVYSFVLGRTE